MQTLPGSFSLLSLSPQHSLLFGVQCLQPLDLRSRLPPLHQNPKVMLMLPAGNVPEVREVLMNLM